MTTRAVFTELLVPLLLAPDAARAAEQLQRQLSELTPPIRVPHIHRLVGELVLDDEQRARALARSLTRAGSTPEAVCVGLSLLVRVGEPQDVPYLRILGQLRDLVGPAVRALDAIDRTAGALVWLGHHAEAPALRGLVEALVAGDAAAVRWWLLKAPRAAPAVGPETARRIAEAAGPAALLSADGPGAPGLAAVTGWLLFQMTSRCDGRAEILSFPGAVPTYEAVVARAAGLSATLDHYGILLSLALDLHSGPSRLHAWGPGVREGLLEALDAVLSGPEYRAVLHAEAGEALGAAERRRLDWARRAARQPFSAPENPARGSESESESAGSGSGSGSEGEPELESAGRLRVETVVGDPVEASTVEVRFLVDGRPLVPEFFGRGSGHSPERLLDSGRLRATDEPREVQLAEAYCTEGCCGALHVTIRRDGDEVVWSDWRCPAPPPSPLHTREIPVYRFDAAAYDAEIARAENDHSWTWPARRVARLIAAGLRDRPELLARWDVELDWVGTDFQDPDRTALALSHGHEDGFRRQSIRYIPEDGTPPEDRAAAALHRLGTEDPRTPGP
ncbi:hypothetical protein ACFVW8_12410 [Streptomyces sp. NPDC058221]|uniref:hypothetical protein n=1 Tax=Streptomyces sp. NPDC058221 TaxID=3346388 RepID=UPI0036EAC1A7